MIGYNGHMLTVDMFAVEMLIWQYASTVQLKTGSEHEALRALNQALGGILQEFVDLDGFTGALVRILTRSGTAKLMW